MWKKTPTQSVLVNFLANLYYDKITTESTLQKSTFVLEEFTPQSLL